MKKRKKPLSQVQKLKQRISELERANDDLVEVIKTHRSNEQSLEKTIEELKEQARIFMSKFEGRVLPVYEERDWLRNLVTMIVVDKEKADMVVEAREEMLKRNRPFGI